MMGKNAAEDPGEAGGRSVTGSWAWAASTIGVGVLAVIGLHLPYIASWLLNTAVILGTAFAVCRHKRSRPAWAYFWALAVICAAMPFMALAGLMDGARSGAYWTVCLALVVAWWGLLAVPVVRPDAPPEVQHVVHHHVIEGAGAAVPAAVPAPAPRVTVPGRVERPAIGAGRIFAGVTIPDGVLQRIGRR